MTPEEICWEAARLIEAKGLYRGGHNSRPLAGSTCVYAAISSVAGEDVYARRAARDKVKAIVGATSDGALIDWNDARWRTAEDVIDVLVAASVADF